MNSGKAETEIRNIFNIKTQKTLTRLLYFERLTPKGFDLFTFLMSDVLFIPFPSKLFRSRIPASFNGGFFYILSERKAPPRKPCCSLSFRKELWSIVSRQVRFS